MVQLKICYALYKDNLLCNQNLRWQSCLAQHGRPHQRFRPARASPPETAGSVVSFTPKDAKVARLMNFRREFTLSEGCVVIQALTEPRIEQTAELLAASFVASLTHLTPYASYVRRNIVRYLREHQAMPPDAVVLVAVLQPETELLASGAPESPNEEDPGRVPPQSATQVKAPFPVLGSATRQRVIGSAEISFRSRTRSSQPFLNPPEDSCYLCNMAVSPAFRRRGVATQLLLAAEKVAVEVMRESEIYLHLRFLDKEAAALYERAGFNVQAEHMPIMPLLGIQRMKLMRKDLGN